MQMTTNVTELEDTASQNIINLYHWISINGSSIHWSSHHYYNIIRIKKKKNWTVVIAENTFIMLIVSNPWLIRNKYPAEHSLTKIV